MDDQLAQLLKPSGPADEAANLIRFPSPKTPEIEVNTPDGPRTYTLKPLRELYGSGTGLSSVDPRDETFQPLLMAIEEAIVRYTEDTEPSLTDGAALLALKPLGLDPDSEPSDPLARRISLALRLNLSVNNYSRQDVKGCIRQVAKSVERHTRVEGPRGYVTFIRGILGRKGRRS